MCTRLCREDAEVRTEAHGGTWLLLGGRVEWWERARGWGKQRRFWPWPR